MNLQRHAFAFGREEPVCGGLRDELRNAGWPEEAIHYRIRDLHGLLDDPPDGACPACLDAIRSSVAVSP